MLKINCQGKKLAPKDWRANILTLALFPCPGRFPLYCISWAITNLLYPHYPLSKCRKIQVDWPTKRVHTLSVVWIPSSLSSLSAATPPTLFCSPTVPSQGSESAAIMESLVFYSTGVNQDFKPRVFWCPVSLPPKRHSMLTPLDSRWLYLFLGIYIKKKLL